jgi:hypothetical protein
MARAVVLDNFAAGKRTIRGQPNPQFRVYPSVVAVPPSAIDEVLGVSTVAARVKLLRRIHDSGWLVCNRSKGRLTNTVRLDEQPDGSRAPRQRWYVFNAPDYPTLRYLIDREKHPARYRR